MRPILDKSAQLSTKWSVSEGKRLKYTNQSFIYAPIPAHYYDSFTWLCYNIILSIWENEKKEIWRNAILTFLPLALL